MGSKVNFEKLNSFFQCGICLGRLNNPHLCSHCSKPSCYNCITKWLREQREQCPNCRASLSINQLVRCCWLADLAKEIEGNIMPNDAIPIPSISHSTRVSSLYRWQPGHIYSQMPEDALFAGLDSDGSSIYVGRAWHDNDCLPAKIIPKKRDAFISYGCEEIPVISFDVLCGKGFKWLESSEGNVPPEAISTGITSYGERLYIGRGRWKGSLTPGKIYPSRGCLYIPYGGRAITLQHYETLVTQE